MRKLKIILLVFILSILGLVINNNVDAATVTLSAPSEVTVGETITVTANINAAQWNLSISKDGTVLNSSNELVNAEANLTKSFSATYTPTSAGTVTFTLSGDYTDIDLTNKEISTTKTVTVKEKVQTPTTPTEPETPSNTETPGTTTPTTPETPTTPQEPETPTAPQEPETPTVTEPKFTDVSRTMYSTRNCNLRASWSTSSAATTINEGTELSVTGISNEKVNGYVWYRVNYNGATKYIANYLLTETKPEEEKKSDNAYLKSLTVEGYELLPVFDKNTTSYTLQIPEDVAELKIVAETEDEKATTEIQGNKDLKEGENTVTVSVNAEDNTIKIYEIKVTKSEKIALGLKTLKIDDTDISRKFRPDVYNYEIDIEDVTKLDIEAVANDETATVEILGNEDLQEGENTITIIVSSQDGEEKVTYQIKANKVVEKVATIVEEEKKEIDPKIYVFIVVGAILLIALVIVIVYTIKHRNEEEYEYTDNFEGFPDDFPGELPERNEEVKLYNNYDMNKSTDFNIPTEKQNNEETEVEERKSKIDYFLDNTDDDDVPRRRRGKHF